MLAAAVGAVLAFLLGRAAELSNLVPFGVAFFAVRPRWWVAAGVAAGAAAGGGLPGLAEALLSLAVCWALLKLLRNRGGGVAEAGLAAAVGRLGAAARWPHVWSLVTGATSGLIAALAALVFVQAVPVLDGWVPEESVAGASLPAFAVLCAAVVAGLSGWAAGPVSLVAVGAALVGGLAARRGPATGVMAGVAVGAVPMLIGGTSPTLLAGLALGGLLGGLFSSWGRIAVGGGCVLGMALADAVYPAAGALWGVLVGAAAGCLVPVAWAPLPRPQRPQPEPLPERLRQMSGALETIGQVVLAAAPAVDEGQPPPQDRLAAFVCPGCRAYARCWERNFVRAYKMVGDLAALAETRPVASSDVGGADTIECLRRGEMARASNLLVANEGRVRALARRLEEERRLVGGEFRAVAGALGAVYGEAAAPRRRPAPRRLDPSTGVACLPRPGRAVSGDTHVVRELGDRLCLALSDGMGSGPAAAHESRAATELLERLLVAGFSAEAAARLVNGTLLLRPDAESFATLDLALVDLIDGSAEIWKLGAAPALIVRARGGDGEGGRGRTAPPEVERIESGPVPAGVFADVDLRVVRRVMRAGDLLVLSSDGVCDSARRGQFWLAEFVAGRAGEGVDALASAILAEAVARAGAAEHDDLTVIACRLREAGGRTAWAK